MMGGAVAARDVADANADGNAKTEVDALAGTDANADGIADLNPDANADASAKTEVVALTRTDVNADAAPASGAPDSTPDAMPKNRENSANGAGNTAALSPAFVYIVQCADGSLYSGWTNDVPKRVAAHNAGRGAKYTKGRRPVQLVYMQPCADKSDALRQEHALKQLPRAAKHTLCAAWQHAAQG